MDNLFAGCKTEALFEGRSLRNSTKHLSSLNDFDLFRIGRWCEETVPLQ